jgi:sulfur-oxidizing protein SoxX
MGSDNLIHATGGNAGMKLGRVIATASATLVMASVSFAVDMAPNDVEFQDAAVTESLTGTPGDAEEGVKVFVDRKLGNCLACHAVSELDNQPFHGDVAPPLDGVADRWKPEELRAIVTDSKEVFGPDTVMPGFYSINVGVDVREDLVGKTILTAQQVEDVVAFLSTLKEPQ